MQLSKRVQAEGEMAGSRAQRMAELNSELKRQASFAKSGGWSCFVRLAVLLKLIRLVISLSPLSRRKYRAGCLIVSWCYASWLLQRWWRMGRRCSVGAPIVACQDL